MKTIPLLFACYLFLQSSLVFAQSGSWTVGEREGRTCLLTPEGKPFMVLGISHASLAMSEGGVKPVAVAERNRRESQIVSDLRGFGINTVAVGFDTWGQAVADPQAWRQIVIGFLERMKGEFPFVAGMDRFVGNEALPAFGSNDPASRFEDVFDPAFKARLREKARLLCELCREHPNCIGYWWSDIPPWGLEAAKKRFGVHWVDFIRALPDAAPGRQRYEAFLKADGPHEDADFLRLIARELYTESASAFREHDSKRLIFGERFNGFNTPIEVLEEAAKVVDVISIQPSGEKIFSADKYDAIHRITKKPIVISDWTLSYPTPEHSVTMWQQLPTPSEAAVTYEAYLRGVFSLPYFLGYFKCQYMDQPLPTGMLKQGLLKPDGTAYAEFPPLLTGIHQRLVTQFRAEGRLEPLPAENRPTGATKAIYEYGPDSLPQPGVPKGLITKHEWLSQIYPGTVRNYWVYVPAQYQKEKPTAMIIWQDGGKFVGQFKVPTVLDNLIHQGDLPPMIGIFVDPGDIPVDGKANPKPKNRSIEYDTLSDLYARFLLEEIIPEVGKTVNLTKDPDQVAIGGSSSGGICAFTVAWNRPDHFRKVISHIGSFTYIRGGDKYPEMIRNTPKKPLRVFLQDGSKDIAHENPDRKFNWFLANKAMAEALDSVGYDHKTVWGEGGHDGTNGAVILPDTLRWMWREHNQR